MSVLTWMGEHPILTVILAVIASDMVVGMFKYGAQLVRYILQ